MSEARSASKASWKNKEQLFVDTTESVLVDTSCPFRRFTVVVRAAGGEACVGPRCDCFLVLELFNWGVAMA